MKHATGTLHVLIGPVGAGKTTFAQQQCAQSSALLLDLDTWMVRLYREDPRPVGDVLQWYLVRRERCRALMWDLALEVLASGTDVYLEIGLLGLNERIDLYEQAHARDLTMRVCVVDAPRDLRRARVLQRNQRPTPYTQIVPAEFFEQASDAWQPPDAAERAAWPLVDV
ncbi:MAG: ATP-binding protein [Polyangiales bacterium]